MKISLNWLKDFVELKTKNIDEIVWRLTEGAAEIEHVEKQGELLDNVVVGYVKESAKHPNADKLTVNKIEGADGKIYPVVCGAPNMRAGIKVAFALSGAKVRWHGEGEPVTLEKCKIRGEVSEGMACAVEEIGLAGIVPQEKGKIAELPMGYPTGANLREILNLDDIVFDVDNHAITHRADLFSQYGFAREMVALGLAKWKKTNKPKKITGKGELPFELKIDESVMSAYAGVVIKNVKSQPSPSWIASKISACGIRPLGLLVDITNFVMLELGMPLHAFDLRSLENKKLNFRKSRKNEKVTTLDSVERNLTENIIVADDGAKIVDLCGIMGGENSEIKEDTTAIYLHAPVYDKVLIRRGMMALKHRTDAGTIYEKGVDAELAMQGILRAVEILREVCPEVQIGSQIVNKKFATKKPKAIALKKSYAEKLLGVKVSDKDVKKIEVLGFEVKENKDGWLVTPPTWRGNLAIPADIVEEILRVRGLNTIEESLPFFQARSPEKNKLHAVRNLLREKLVGMGFFENISFSLTGGNLIRRAQDGTLRENWIELENAVSEDFAYYRPSILPRMLENLENNLHAGNKEVKVFELGHIGWAENKKLVEKNQLAILLCPEKKMESFFAVKGAVEEIWKALGIKTKSAELKTAPTYLHPARNCQWGEFGFAGELHPSIQKEFDAKERVAVAVLDLDKVVAEYNPTHIKVKALPKFPSMTRDIALIFAENVRSGEILEKIRKASDLLSAAELFDVYVDKNLKEKKQKSLAFHLEYRADDHTLTETEVETEHAKVLKILAECGGTAR